MTAPADMTTVAAMMAVGMVSINSGRAIIDASDEDMEEPLQRNSNDWRIGLRAGARSASLSLLRLVVDRGFIRTTRSNSARAEAVMIVREVYADRIVDAFKVEHNLTDADFATDHWETLFALAHPELRP